MMIRKSVKLLFSYILCVKASLELDNFKLHKDTLICMPVHVQVYLVVCVPDF